MKILALDTSTEACSAALLFNQQISSRFEVAAQQHTNLILPMCEHLLADAGIAIGQLDAIAVTRGPGSFTGIRIGAGICQGIALAHDTPVITLSSLQILAQTTHRKTSATQVYSLLDARMNEVYACSYALQNSIMLPSTEEKLLSPQEILIDSQTIPAGVGWLRYKEELGSNNIETIVEWPEAEDMLPIAHNLFTNNKTIDACEIELQYLRNDVARKPSK